MDNNSSMLNLYDENLTGSSKSAVLSEYDEDVKEFDQLYNDGYKFKLSEDYEQAIHKLSEAAELGVELFGQFAPQGYLPHYQYGRTLLEAAIKELQMVEISKVVKDDGAGTDNDDGKDETPCNNADAATVGESESPIPDSGENKGINAVQEKDDNTKPNEENTEDDYEEPSTLELAWEVLDTARMICEKQEPTAEWLNKKADVLVALGECAMADENFEVALEELGKALKIRIEQNSSVRVIAEVHYQIGNTYKLMGSFGKAAESFSQAKSLLSSQLGQSDVKPEEVEPILSDLNSLILDCNESEVQAKAILQSLQKIIAQRSDENLTPLKNANDLTNMIRKTAGNKRPGEFLSPEKNVVSDSLEKDPDQGNETENAPCTKKVKLGD